MKKLVVIGDYCDDTLVTQELRSAIQGFLKDSTGAQISFVSSTPSTIHTAFLLGQLVMTEVRYGRPQETVFFVNTDPRLEKKEHVAQAKGSKGVVLRLASGIMITGPNAGYSFSLVKSEIEKAYLYPALNKGSQFRSRDNYARVIAHLMDYMESELELEDTSIGIVPEFRGSYIGHIDNYGNIKTTIPESQFKGKYEYDETVRIRIGQSEHAAVYVDNLFGGVVGQLVVYPGSSGKPDDRYLEISAWSHFGNTGEEASKTGRDFFPGIKPGMEIELQ